MVWRWWRRRWNRIKNSSIQLIIRICKEANELPYISLLSNLETTIMKNKFKRIIITTGALLMMTMAPISQANPLGEYMSSMTTITAQAAELNQSPRWHADSNGVWYLKNEAGTGNVVNSWFQDLDDSWYLLAPNDGHMYAGLIHDTLTDKWYYCQTEHDGYYGRMAHTDGVYTVNNQQVHLTFNQNQDGTFGAITSGLSSLQSTGVASQDVAGLPTESTGANTGGSGQSVDNTEASNNQTGNNGTEVQSDADDDWWLEQALDMMGEGTNKYGGLTSHR